MHTKYPDRKERRVRTSVTLPNALDDWLRAEAKRHHVSMSAIIEAALISWVERVEDGR